MVSLKENTKWVFESEGLGLRICAYVENLLTSHTQPSLMVKLHVASLSILENGEIIIDYGTGGISQYECYLGGGTRELTVFDFTSFQELPGCGYGSLTFNIAILFLKNYYAKNREEVIINGDIYTRDNFVRERRSFFERFGFSFEINQKNGDIWMKARLSELKPYWKDNIIMKSISENLSIDKFKVTAESPDKDPGQETLTSDQGLWGKIRNKKMKIEVRRAMIDSAKSMNQILSTLVNSCKLFFVAADNSKGDIEYFLTHQSGSSIPVSLEAFSLIECCISICKSREHLRSNLHRIKCPLITISDYRKILEVFSQPSIKKITSCQKTISCNSELFLLIKPHQRLRCNLISYASYFALVLTNIRHNILALQTPRPKLAKKAKSKLTLNNNLKFIRRRVKEVED